MRQRGRWFDVWRLVLALAVLVAVTAALRSTPILTNATIAALSYLLVVLVTAMISALWVAIAASVSADLLLNYFFLPPLGTFVIADPENWVALFTFLAVSLTASKLSAASRERARQAIQLVEERKTAELARQRDQLKSALLASLAHDLRTPLTAIRVAASNLQTSWLADGDRAEQSDLILAEVRRLDRLFENILEMARIDAGAVSAEARWVHPSEIVEAARDQAGLTLNGHPLDVTIESETLVHLDPRLTAAALAQLLENAARHTPSSSPISVKVSVSREGLEVTIRDRGPGIAAEDLPHLFERFYRGRDTGQRVQGTGMGLSIARGLLSAERGRVWAENCPDGGARFTIAVPAESRAPASGEPGA